MEKSHRRSIEQTNDQTPEVRANSAPSWDWTGTGTGTGAELTILRFDHFTL